MIKERVVFVTGSTKGIGLSIAKIFQRMLRYFK